MINLPASLHCWPEPATVQFTFAIVGPSLLLNSQYDPFESDSDPPLANVNVFHVGFKVERPICGTTTTRLFEDYLIPKYRGYAAATD